MRIDLNPLAPMAAPSSGAMPPVAEITGRMALAMAAAELAAHAGQTGSQQSDARSQQRALTPPPLPVRAPASASTLAWVATAASAPESLRSLATPDRVTLSNTAAMWNPPRAANVATPATVLSLPSMPAVAAGRVPVTPTVVAPSVDLSALSAKPPAQFLTSVLQSLTGETPDQLHLLDLRPLTQNVETSYGPQLATAKVSDSLNLLLQGVVRTADGQQLPFGLTAAVARGAIDTAHLPTLMALLSQQDLMVDYPGVARDLAGQALHFQLALDPRNLWPLQSFLFSGSLTLGNAKPTPHDEEEWQWVWEEDEDPHDGLPRQRRRKLKPKPHDPVNEMPDDGGPPLISGGRWLELELRHLRQELRIWMGLPEPAV